MSQDAQQVTEYAQVQLMFHSMPMTKSPISEIVQKQYFLSALAEYELIVRPLNFDVQTDCFAEQLPGYVVYTLALMMYTRYLMQELSRVLKLNGISGKDIQLTGVPAAKTYTSAELQNELLRVKQLLYQQGKHCFV